MADGQVHLYIHLPQVSYIDAVTTASKVPKCIAIITDMPVQLHMVDFEQRTLKEDPKTKGIGS